MDGKIPCVVLVFYNYDIIKRSLDFLQNYSDRLDIHVLENPSPHTDSEIKPYILDLVNKNIVSKYILFDRNISNNAYEVFFTNSIVDQLEQHKYLLVTDGDVIACEGDFLSEEIGILDNNEDVFACSVTIDLNNLPLANYPEAGLWIPPIINRYPAFNEGVTGAQLLLIRSKDFLEYLKYVKLRQLKFVDGSMHQFCYQVLKKKWARTKKSTCIHLTWDIYSDKNHPYHQWKSQFNFQALWYHNEYCSFQLFTKDS